MTDLPRNLKRNNRTGIRARERHDANQQRKHDEKWRRIRETEKPDPLKSKMGSPRGSTTGFRRKAK